jgi:predicted ArsR family transcriptional regulator
MLVVEVIESPGAAELALDPVRSRLLAELSQPASAAALAARLGIPRQKINYHLRALEAHGLVRVAQTRRWGGITERLLEATAATYIVSPSALGPIAADPERETDRLSASYLVALAGRIVREVGQLMRRARAEDKFLATLSIDTQVRFQSAADRAAFSRELVSSVTHLVARYHDTTSPDGRDHRLVIVAHPLLKEQNTTEEPPCQ